MVLIINNDESVWPYSPVVTAIREQSRDNLYPYETVSWNSPTICIMKFGRPDGRITVDLNFRTAISDNASFQYKIEKVNKSNNVINPQDYKNVTVRVANPSVIKTEEVFIDEKFYRFKITVRVMDADPRGGDPRWYDPHINYFTIYARFYGDFSLKYIPITILYCPPELDMVNSILQSESYGTRLAIGSGENAGTQNDSSFTIHGNASLKTISSSNEGDGGGGGGGARFERDYTTGNTGAISASNSLKNRIRCSFEWKTLLSADNRRAIGRAYWGALGDIFLLFKNPWFELISDEDNNLLIGISSKTAFETEILAIPAHRLLIPGDDPIASKISPENRKRLLKLDPFIKNISRFFPDYISEGIECYVSSITENDHIPIYRGWNGSDHFYTTDEDEITDEYRKDGVVFYIADSPLTNHVPFYRLYKFDNHFYTTNINEKNNAINNEGFIDEGILGYVIPKDSSDIFDNHFPLFRAYNSEIFDHFYTIDESEFNNKTKPPNLNEAVNQTNDPSHHIEPNRACLIARYSIDNGIILDLSQQEEIEVDDYRVNSHDYYAEVSEKDSEALDFFGEVLLGNGLVIGGGAGVVDTSGTKEYCKLSYFESTETYFQFIANASCTLIRNQNVADLHDIEVWYDKIFSTFMFRKPIKKFMWRFEGWILYEDFIAVGNIPVEMMNISESMASNKWGFMNIIEDLDIDITDHLEIIEFSEIVINYIIKHNLNIDIILNDPPIEKLTTMTDNLGHFRFNIDKEGIYLLIVGDIKKKIILLKDRMKGKEIVRLKISNVRRIFNVHTSPLWEFQDILNISSKKANKIFNVLRKQKNLDNQNFLNILKKNNLSLFKFKKRAVLTFGGSLKGHIYDASGSGVKYLDVILVRKNMIKNYYPKILSEEQIEFDLLIKRIPKDFVQKSKSNHLGEYYFSGLSDGEYMIIAGNKKLTVEINGREIQHKISKIVDVMDIKRFFDPVKASTREYINLFKISKDKAIQLKRGVAEFKSLGREEFEKILTEFESSMEKLKTSVNFIFKNETSKNK